MHPFIVNKNAQSNGDHEVHQTDRGTSCLPDSENRIELGSFDNCHEAVAAAKRRYPDWKVNGCAYCAPDCHTG